MTIPPRAALRFAPLSLLLATSIVAASRPARAQNAPPPAGALVPIGAATPVAPPTPAEVPPDMSPAPPATPTVAEPEALTAGPVERLAASAFPEWKNRGIQGGSLRMTTFSGMPWPYFPKSGIGLSGYAWLDTGYEQIDRGTTSTNEAHTVKYMLQQGRAALRITPTYSSGQWYVQAQAEVIANKDQTLTQPNVVDIDDLWVRTGAWKSWDLTIGRFEGFEVYHLGMGLDINTLERNGATDDIRSPPGIHGFQYGFLRPPNVGNVALHLYPGSSLRIELLGQVGNEGGLNTVGGRPAIIFDLGWLKLKAAGEGRKQSAIADTSLEERTTYGATGAIQFVFDPYIEFGLNADWGKVAHYRATATMSGSSRGDYDAAGSVTTLAFGGFANARVFEDLVIGAGANYITEEDNWPDVTTQVNGKFTHLQAFGALQYVVHKKLFIKVVGGYALANLAPSNSGGLPPWDNGMFSGRIRFLYAF